MRISEYLVINSKDSSEEEEEGKGEPPHLKKIIIKILKMIYRFFDLHPSFLHA